MSLLRRPLALVALLAVVVLASSCSSGGDDAAATTTTSTSTSSTTTVVTTTTTTTTTVPEPTTAPPAPAPSVVPPAPPAPGGAGSVDVCVVLAEVLPVPDLIPRDGVSWPDERMRVEMDARRDAALYASAQPGAPAALSEPLVVLADFTGWLADEVRGTSSAADARRRIDTYPAQGEVGAAASEVDRWRGVNCA
ncbi:hypothetical protein [Rhabdothermincola salaria]|uniref:hypothetical protein n=1 Tax=Rhabdothermincola salaria TaxID=2903142 RepID=UPI001E3DC723|nr:hypothetical protein [Rhabdothermincola salaria]MCD9625446.1 hypothetical protein [Rhabdothermincola salaria]